MALKATVHKVDLAVSDMDRGYYGNHALMLARHPSETSERMMVRLLAFAMFADEALTYGRGLSADDEPALWLKDLTGNIECWIDVGLPDERELRKACGRARRVVLLRRPLKVDLALSQQVPGQLGEQAELFFPGKNTRTWEYATLVTNSSYEPQTIAQLYRDRADAENSFDELKNQWGWGGFTT